MRFSAEAIAAVRFAAFAFAVAALLLSTFGRRYGLVRFAPGGSSFDTLIRPIFVAIFVVALLVAMRWEIVGGLIAAFAAAGLVAFAAQQLRTGSAVLVVVAFAIPALLWFIIDVHALSAKRAAWAVGAAVALSAVGFLLGQFAYRSVWGATHPESMVEPLPDSAVAWVWSGRVGPNEATVRAKIDRGYSLVELLVDTDSGFADPAVVAHTGGLSPVVSFDIGGLQADTTHHYAVRVDGVVDEVRTGQFRTFPVGPSSFKVVFGACARVGSNGRVFDAINEQDPLLYMILGDMHYGDNDVDNIDDYRDVLDLTLSQPGQAALYRSRGIAYVWDDHDFGANDANSASTSRAAAMASYREYVPSYDLAGAQSSIHQAFTIGRVRFILTDARSARDDQAKVDDADKTMLGLEQKQWFLSEMAQSSQDHELVVWINPVPWVADTKVGADNWGGYATERAEIANFIVDRDIDNLVMISGDAHMVAIDDGTNTNFSEAPGPGFPLLHSAALDRPGSTKGGPYSEGAIAGSGQYGMLEVADDGVTVSITLSALRWDGAELLTFTFDVAER